MENSRITELAENFKAGDTAAFSELYSGTYARIKSALFYITQNEAAAEDLAQETYLQIYKSIGQLNDPAYFMTWANKIAANKANAYYRTKMSKEIAFSTMEDSDEPSEAFRAYESSLEADKSFAPPEEQLEEEETRRLLRQIIDALPENQRFVITMFYYEDLSIREIAETLGQKEGTVKSSLSRGRDKIRDEVLGLEKKGVKLRSLAPFTFFLWLFRSEAKAAAEVFVGAGAITAATGAAAAGTVTAGAAAAGSTAAGTTAAGAAVSSAGTGALTVFFSSMGFRIAAVSVAALIAAAGTAFGITKFAKQSGNAEQTVSETVSEDRSEPSIEGSTVTDASESAKETKADKKAGAEAETAELKEKETLKSEERSVTSETTAAHAAESESSEAENRIAVQETGTAVETAAASKETDTAAETTAAAKETTASVESKAVSVSSSGTYIFMGNGGAVCSWGYGYNKSSVTETNGNACECPIPAYSNFMYDSIRFDVTVPEGENAAENDVFINLTGYRAGYYCTGIAADPAGTNMLVRSAPFTGSVYCIHFNFASIPINGTYYLIWDVYAEPETSAE